MTGDKSNEIWPLGKVTCDKSNEIWPLGKVTCDKSNEIWPLEEVTCDTSNEIVRLPAGSLGRLRPKSLFFFVCPAWPGVGGPHAGAWSSCGLLLVAKHDISRK